MENVTSGIYGADHFVVGARRKGREGGNKGRERESKNWEKGRGRER